LARVGAVLVAAGSSKRVGPGVPKQFRMLGLKPMFVAALEPLVETCDEVVVVAPSSELEATRRVLAESGVAAKVVAGGTRRQDSVGEGLKALSEGVDVVLIHDAARPFATRALVERVVAAALEHGAALPVVPVKDTVKRVEDGAVVASLDRSMLGLAQTPQGFRRDVLLSARDAAADTDVTDDVQCVEMAGGRVAVVDGDPGNVKVTDAWDMELASLRCAVSAGFDTQARAGIGSDCHVLVDGRRLVLCGVLVPFPKGLDGWSDADVATHAVMDALLGAAGERDIGHLFPPGDERYRDADSIGMLREVVELLASKGLAVGSVDVTITAEAPRLAPHVGSMKDVLADALGVGVERVSVKATTTEGTGAEGRGEAISARAVAVVRRAKGTVG